MYIYIYIYICYITSSVNSDRGNLLYLGGTTCLTVPAAFIRFDMLRFANSYQ